MPLLVVQSFVNTYEADTGVDLLGDPESARSWLMDAGLVGGASIAAIDLERAREVRESLRSLLVHNGGGDPLTTADLKPMADLAERSRLRLLVGDDGLVEMEADLGSQSIRLADLLLIVRDAQQDGTWKRLKACRNDECLWAFYDRSHAGRGAWCDMATCGNRIKNRHLRSRRSSLA